MSRLGRAPPELPEWLRIPYLVPAKGARFRIIHQGGSINTCIQGGDPLYLTHGQTLVGTLGTVMTDKDTHVVLTAGHIIEDGDPTMVVRRGECDHLNQGLN